MSKWAEKSDPEMPARDFAEAVLAERMEIVESTLPLAAYHHRDDVEHVHQLRVSSRRSAAALRAFAPLMRKKPRKLKDWLSRIRDAAGPARDIDVLLDRFAGESAPDEVTLYASKRLADERQTAQKSLVKIAKEALSGKLDQIVEKTLESLANADHELSLAEFGHSSMQLAYVSFIRLAQVVNPTTSELHQLRIAGKKLRYSLEIFHGLFPAQLREEIYPIVVELQARLGEINDHVTGQALFQSWLAQMPPDDLAARVARRVTIEREDALRMARSFLLWWNAARLAKVETFFETCRMSHDDRNAV